MNQKISPKSSFEEDYKECEDYKEWESKQRNLNSNPDWKYLLHFQNDELSELTTDIL